VFSAGAEELEEVLEEGDELVLALAVGEEEGEEDREVAGAYEYLFSELFGDLTCGDGTTAQVLQRAYALEGHLIMSKLQTIEIFILMND
jgi:hypothetical protein